MITDRDIELNLKRNGSECESISITFFIMLNVNIKQCIVCSWLLWVAVGPVSVFSFYSFFFRKIYVKAYFVYLFIDKI